MSEINFDKIGLKVGLEIHQQLSTNKKLFCSCSPLESDEFTIKFSRKLRATKSELGEYDPAALFENRKSKTMIYYANPQSSCLVEQDDEPPHEIDLDALNIALTIACSLRSSIFNEIHPMRKIVVDGSNTSGFQRTMLVAQGGCLDVEGKRIGVQSVCLEEDAAKLIKDEEKERSYSLDRLGIPLVEIALEPVDGNPSEIRKIALALGRLLRTTKKVTRGIGSIRQDVNISVKGGGIVEVKGVQQLDQLEKVIEYEAKRQRGLILISEKLKNLKLGKISKNDVFDVTEHFRSCNSKIIKKAIDTDASIKVIKAKNFAGLFTYEPYDGIRLGKELGQIVRFYGIGGIFHSDELPNYGIENSDIQGLQKLLEINSSDGFIIIAGENSKIDFAIDSIIKRIEDVKNGVPAETRGVIPSGETVFLRPRPGASRMYPETDIPSLVITDEQLKLAKSSVPKSWDESLHDIQREYSLNTQLAEQIFDSDYLELFEKICLDKRQSPNFVASILCSTITNLQRQGLNASLLKPEYVLRSFELLINNKITKESMEIIFEIMMSGKAKSVEEAIEKTAITNLDESKLSIILDKIIHSNSSIIIRDGARSLGPLMGIAMKELRGKASGEQVNLLLGKKIQKFLSDKNKN
ncbi:MAG: Glu-tRNA(Gln) amidotransferase subunit GatE [Nitrososphaerota archaeon]